MVKEIFTKICQPYSTDIKLVLSLFSEISEEYNSSKRFYHNFSHIQSMLTELAVFEAEIENYENLALAIIYHDVIYNAKRNDNEEKSAELARNQLQLLRIPEQNICKLEKLIISTKDHKAFQNSFDEKIFLDLDLLVLGSSESEYHSYTAKIRKEYSFVPLFLYKKKRKEVMQIFLKEERLFLTDYFFEKYEKQARKNIEREIFSLK